MRYARSVGTHSVTISSLYSFIDAVSEISYDLVLFGYKRYVNRTIITIARSSHKLWLTEKNRIISSDGLMDSISNVLQLI